MTEGELYAPKIIGQRGKKEKLGVFTRREMSRSLNFNPVSIDNKMKDRLLLSFSRNEAKYYILFSNEEKRLFVAYTILRAIKII